MSRVSATVASSWKCSLGIATEAASVELACALTIVKRESSVKRERATPNDGVETVEHVWPFDDGGWRSNRRQQCHDIPSYNIANGYACHYTWPLSSTSRDNRKNNFAPRRFRTFVDTRHLVVWYVLSPGWSYKEVALSGDDEIGVICEASAPASLGGWV